MIVCRRFVQRRFLPASEVENEIRAWLRPGLGHWSTERLGTLTFPGHNAYALSAIIAQPTARQHLARRRSSADQLWRSAAYPWQSVAQAQLYPNLAVRLASVAFGCDARCLSPQSGQRDRRPDDGESTSGLTGWPPISAAHSWGQWSPCATHVSASNAPHMGHISLAMESPAPANMDRFSLLLRRYQSAFPHTRC
jgi:hypothetical protein